MKPDDIVITGLGVTSALGPDVPAFLAGLRSGQTAIAKLSRFDASGCRSDLVGQAPAPRFPAAFSPPRYASRPDSFGIMAALEAVADAGLPPEALAKAAVCFGTGVGGAESTEGYLRTLMEHSPGNPLPAMGPLIAHQPAAVTDLVARVLSAHGPRATFMTACSSSALSISQGRDLILLGHADVALCGGADGLCPLTVAGFSALRATSPELCCPFDRDRKGLNLGEGAAVLILERGEHARRRGARPYARLIGTGLSCDAYHMTAPQPEGEGALLAMRAACRDAGIAPSAISYVNAHGTGTPHNDAAETAALRQLLGDHSARVPLSSIKSLLGHTLGAAGAIEAVASVLSIVHGLLPPTAQLQTPDPAFAGSDGTAAFDFVMGAARQARCDVVLSNSFAFGGNNAALLFAAA
jgi:3-oxoacyl-[acyl-carrier-protein] synthase II